MSLRILANKYLCLRRIYCLNNQDTREPNGERDKLYRVSQDLRAILQDLIPELMLSQKRHIHMGPICNGSGVMRFYSTVNKLERKEEHCVFIEICCYVSSYRFAVQHSSKLFKVSSICLDTFSDLCDQTTWNLTKHCGIVDASCSAENSLE